MSALRFGVFLSASPNPTNATNANTPYANATTVPNTAYANATTVPNTAYANATPVPNTAIAAIVATTVDSPAHGCAANAIAEATVIAATTVIATIVGGRRVAVAHVTVATNRCYGCGCRISISCTPTSRGLGAFKGKKRSGDYEGRGYCSYAHLTTPFRIFPALTKCQLLGRKTLR
jgi:hypothetical protein